jgi:hypothetical protein
MGYIKTSGATPSLTGMIQLLQSLHTEQNGMTTGQKDLFYAKVDSEHRVDFKDMLMSPLEISFSLKKPKCAIEEDPETCYKAFNVVVEKIGSGHLIQEFLAYNIFPTCIGWKLLKEMRSKEGELVTLAFEFKE